MTPQHRPRTPRVPKHWYDVAAMAQLFDCSERAIWKQVRAGKLPKPVQRGRKWSRWPRHQIDQLIRELTKEVA